MSTLTVLSAALLDKLGLQTTDGLAQPATLTRAINIGLQRISSIHDWPWLYVEGTIVTVANQQAYVQVAPWTRTAWIGYNDDLLGARQRQDLVQYALVSGVPRLYAVVGSTIYLAATPDAIYTLAHGYYKTEPLLVSGTDVPLLPAAYDDFVISAAGMYMAGRFKDPGLKNIMTAEYTEWVKIAADDVRRTSTIPKIRVRTDTGL